MSKKLGIVVCENFEKEVQEIIRLKEWTDVLCEPFSSDCHKGLINHKNIINNIKIVDKCEKVIIIGSSCLLNIDDKNSNNKKVKIKKNSSCFGIVIGQSLENELVNNSSYLISPGWLVKWKSWIKESKFNRQTAELFFKESCNKLTFINTCIFKDINRELGEFSNYLNIPYEILTVGLDYATLYISEVVIKWRNENQEKNNNLNQLTQTKKLSDYTMILDVISQLVDCLKEEDIILKVIDLFNMLFAPKQTVYISIYHNNFHKKYIYPENDEINNIKVDELMGFKGEYELNPDQNGFKLSLEYNNQRIGIIEVSGFSFPEYNEHYLNTALNIAKFYGLAINNARQFSLLEKSKKAIKENEQLLWIMLNSIGDAVIATNNDGYITFINPVASKLIGYNIEEIFNKTIYELMVFKDFNGESIIENPIKIVLETKESIYLQKGVLLEIDNGIKFPVADSASPIKDINDNVIGVIFVFRDVSKEFEDELKIKNLVSELKESNKIKDKFFSIISHDLKNPFNTILGFSDVIMNEVDELSKNEIKDFSKRINQSCVKQHKLLENLLLWSRSQMGKIVYTPEKIDLFNTVGSVIDILNENAKKKQVSIINRVKEQVFIYLDYNMFQSILLNILSNAIKFTPKKGTITFSLSEDDNDCYVILNIRDTGVGLSPEQVKGIFRIDQKSMAVGTEGETGTGLGLILCKEFIEINKGKIRVESEEGKGTVFKLNLLKFK